MKHDKKHKGKSEKGHAKLGKVEPMAHGGKSEHLKSMKDHKLKGK